MTPSEHAESSFELPEDLVEAGAVRNPYPRREIKEGQETLYATA